MHLLLFLHPDDHFLDANKIDAIICAELPESNLQQSRELFEIIKTVMVHRPCGDINIHVPCMQTVNGTTSCSKRFPKAFQEETILQEDGYPLYRRRNNGQSFTTQVRTHIGMQTFTFNNQYVVPYNPYLSWRYKAHINVEVCASVQAIKYIHKYIYKGSDRTTIQLSFENDEVNKYFFFFWIYIYVTNSILSR